MCLIPSHAIELLRAARCGAEQAHRVFLGQSNANWPLDFADLTDNARTLSFNAIDYSLPPAVQPTLSVARSGNNLVITYAGGTLRSADNLTPMWTNESLASGTPIPVL